jgi:hypothetical protein
MGRGKERTSTHFRGTDVSFSLKQRKSWGGVRGCTITKQSGHAHRCGPVVRDVVQLFIVSELVRQDFATIRKSLLPGVRGKLGLLSQDAVDQSWPSWISR